MMETTAIVTAIEQDFIRFDCGFAVIATLTHQQRALCQVGATVRVTGVPHFRGIRVETVVHVMNERFIVAEQIATDLGFEVTGSRSGDILSNNWVVVNTTTEDVVFHWWNENAPAHLPFDIQTSTRSWERNSSRQWVRYT